jgi:surfeit locus 1 family protein
MPGGWQFKPPWWSVVGLLLFGALFASLSLWQLDRAAEKRDMLAQYERGGTQPVIVDAGAGFEAAARYQWLELRGRWLAERQFLLEPATRGGQAGYRVWSPLEPRAGGPVVIVDRGWIARRDADHIELQAGEVSLTGRVDRLPSPGIRLRSPTPEGDWPRRVYFPTAELLSEQLDREVADGRLRLDPDGGPGFHREWQPVSMSPERHLGYAFQWAALTVALLVIFIVLNLRCRKHDS